MSRCSLTSFRSMFAGLTIAICGLVTSSSDVLGEEYVWARSNWGGGPNRPYGAMSNGYGGYYVPKRGYGNNYEGQPFRNPNGFIIPAQTVSQTTSKPRSTFWWHRK